MITCNLTKLETALEATKKAYPKLKPTDAALVASALTLTGRHAIAIYDGTQYTWPEDYEKLTGAVARELEMASESIEAPKKVSKTEEVEPITVTVGLMPNLVAGEKQLEGFDKLKALLSDILQEGVEFVYAPSDLGWQWALDRANWETIGGQDFGRRIKIKASFTEGAVGVELGSGGTKKRSRAKAAPVAVAEPEPEAEAQPEAEA